MKSNIDLDMSHSQEPVAEVKSLTTYVIAFIISIPLILVLFVTNMLWDGFVLTKLWLWFIVPQFNLPKLPLTIAIGFSLIASLLTTHPQKNGPKMKTYVFHIIFTPLFVLLAGYIVHRHFMP